MKELITRPHVIVSVENPAYPKKTDRPISTRVAERALSVLGGGKVIKIDGHYTKPELSLLISNPSEKQLRFARYLSHATGQESHIESDGHSHKMYYVNGPEAGRVVHGKGTVFHETPPEDFYSRLPDGTIFTHNFDEIEKSLEKAADEPLDFSDAPGEGPKALTVHGQHVAPNEKIRYNTKSILDPDKGVLHTPKGSFNLYVPHHTDSDYQKILTSPDIQDIHTNAMKNWMRLNKLHQEGKKIPDEIMAHANAFSILSANTPVPQQELSYSRLVDTMKQKGLDLRNPEFSEQFQPGGGGRRGWKESDSPTELPQHSRPYWERIKPVITQQEFSEGTGRQPGDIVALGTLDSFSDRLARYPGAHEYLKQLTNTHGADSRAIVSQMMADKANPKLPKDHPMKTGFGLGSKTARYAASMMGGGNTVVPDTHFVRHMFGLDSNTDSDTITYLKNTLWNPKNHHLLNTLDEYYHKNHPAVKFVQDKYFGGKEDPNAIFPAFWLHWLSIAPHEKVRGIGKPYAAKNLTDHTPLWDTAEEVLNRHGLGGAVKKSESDVPKHVRTAAAMAELEQKLGIVPAQMVYYAYLVPQLLGGPDKPERNELSRDELNELARQHKDQLPGGLADDKMPSDFDPKAIEQGIQVELEHTGKPALAQEIAMDHLSEDPKYYDKLKQMESKKLDKGDIVDLRSRKKVEPAAKKTKYKFKNINGADHLEFDYNEPINDETFEPLPEAFLNSNKPLTKAALHAISRHIDYSSDVVDRAHPDHDADVLDWHDKYLGQMKTRLENSIAALKVKSSPKVGFKKSELNKARFESGLPAGQKRDIRRQRREAAVEPQPVNEMYQPHPGAVMPYPPRSGGENIAGISEVGAKVREAAARRAPATREAWQQAEARFKPPHVQMSPERLNEFAATQALEAAKGKIHGVLRNRRYGREQNELVDPKIPGPESIQETKILDPKLVAAEKKPASLKKSPPVVDQMFADTHPDLETIHQGLATGRPVKTRRGVHTMDLGGGDFAHYVTANGKPGGKVISYSKVYPANEDAPKGPYFSSSWTHPDYRGRGLSQRIHQHAADFHGGVYSDTRLSPDAHRVYRAIGAQLAPTGGYDDEEAEAAQHFVPPRRKTAAEPNQTGLRKSPPLVAEQSPRFAETQINEHAFDPQRHVGLSTKKIGENLFYHTYGDRDRNFIVHSFSHGRPEDPIAVIGGSHRSEAGEKPMYSATYVATHPMYQGQGLGTRLKELAVRHHGKMRSDAIISPAEHRSWEKLKDQPGVKVDLGETTESIPVDGDGELDDQNEALRSRHVARVKKSDTKGVHDTYIREGMSQAGVDIRRYSKNPARDWVFLEEAKQQHKKKLKELKEMPKPSLPKSEQMQKMSRPRLSFPKLGIGREEHNVKTVATPRQKKLLIHEAVNEAAPKIAASGRPISEFPSVRSFRSSVTPTKFGGMNLLPSDPSKSRSGGKKQTTFVFTGKYGPKVRPSWGVDPNKPGEQEIAIGRRLDSSVAHEAAHRVMGRIEEIHGNEARKAVLNHLIEHALPNVEDRNALFGFVKKRGYSPKSDHFDEEMINSMRDVLVDPGFRRQFVDYHQSSTGKDPSDFINTLKSGWQRLYNRSQNLTHEDVLDLVGKKGT